MDKMIIQRNETIGWGSQTFKFWIIQNEPEFPHQGSLNYYQSFCLRLYY